MDPDETLRLLRKAREDYLNAREGSDQQQAAAENVVDRMATLDRWLSDGGFLPKAWTPEGRF